MRFIASCRRPGTAALLLVALLAASATSAGVIPESGDLAAELAGIIIPGAGSMAFIEPSSADLIEWQMMIQSLLAEDYGAAAALAENQQYQLVEFTDLATEEIYYLLREETDGGGVPVRALGTFVYNPHPQRDLNIQAPHAAPGSDRNTRTVGIRMFLDLQTIFLEITGTHRCANTGMPGCGSSAVCGGPNYLISDAAHYTSTFYQMASNEVAAFFPELVTVSVHGFSACEEFQPETSLVVISNGTGGLVDDGLATQLAAVYNALLDQLPDPYAGLGGGSCNADPSSPLYRAWPCDNDPFCGQSNTQGRWINGSVAPCTTSVPNAPLPERFIHLEQQSALRDSPPGDTFPGVSYQITIDAFATLFPAAIWIDFFYPGPEETGTFSRPFNSLAEGLSAAADGALIRIKAGTSPETLVVSQSVVITSFGGSAILGN